jgi:hypothetical protein
MKKYLLIFTVFLISFILSNLLIKNVFLANTPKVNPFFISNITGKIKNQYIAFFDSFDNKNADSGKTNRNTETIFESISQGVYAAQTENGTVVKVVSEEIDWTEYAFNLNGKEIKIKVPKGQSPPDQESVENLYQ